MDVQFLNACSVALDWVLYFHTLRIHRFCFVVLCTHNRERYRALSMYEIQVNIVE